MLPNEVPPGKGVPWFQKHGREMVDLAALGIALVVVRLLVAVVPFYAALCAFVVAALVPLRPIVGQTNPLKELLAAVPRQVASVVVTGALLRYLLAQPLTCLWFGALWPVLSLALRLDRKEMLIRIRRPARFAVVGVIVMGVFMGLNRLFGQEFGKDVSFILAYPPAVALHFWLNKKWTFSSKRTDSGRQASEYLIMVVITFAIQAAVFKALTVSTALPVVTFLVMQYRIFGRAPLAE
jgi:putative flippase GtrA